MKIRDISLEQVQDDIKEAIRAYAPTQEWSEEFAEKLILEADLKVIFRAVGGNSQRSEFNEYTVVPYLVIYETRTSFYTYRHGRMQLQVKRTTSNSRFFDDADQAVRCVLDRIDETLKAIHSSWLAIKDISGDGIPASKRLFIGKFNGKNRNKERFALVCVEVVRSTKKAWYIDTGVTKTVQRKRGDNFVSITMPKGRCYIYPHQSEPHDPGHPFEKWIMQSEDIIKLTMQSYYEQRVQHLRKQRQRVVEVGKNYGRQTDEARLSECVQSADVSDSVGSQLDVAD